jgi:predicted kinase
MQFVYILIGTPACGKTCWATRNAQCLGVTILSADVIREDLRRSGGDPFDGKWVFATMARRLEQLLAEGTSAIVDATHWRRAYRAYAVERARSAGALAVGVWFDIPLDICMTRNAARLGSQPGMRREEPETLRRIHVGLEPPTPDEVDHVRRITMAG